jgi:hypothetical protein
MERSEPIDVTEQESRSLQGDECLDMINIPVDDNEMKRLRIR